MNTSRRPRLLQALRQGEPLSSGEQTRLVLALSTPAILGQVSSIAMLYIDAIMVGRMGAEASAAVGVTSTTVWLLGGLCLALSMGFCVMVAHAVGAGRLSHARQVLRNALAVCLTFATVLGAASASVSQQLPLWLGVEGQVARMASNYFLVWALALPATQLMYLANGMLRCSGNMLVPGLLGVGMCAVDAVLNALFIPRWGVAGASLATALATAACAVAALGWLLWRSRSLRLVGRGEGFNLRADILRRAMGIGVPLMLERTGLNSAQVASTVILSGLGTVAIAANSFAIIIESLCYMPGYGIGEAATTLVGQSHGAGRPAMSRSLARHSLVLGIGVMALAAAAMWMGAPWLMTLMTPSAAVQAQAVVALRIVAWVEPLFGAAIVSYAIFVGLGKSLWPSCINFSCIWLVRIPLALWLAREMGLAGVWIAMSADLCLRGLLFLYRIARWQWAGRFGRCRKGHF